MKSHLTLRMVAAACVTAGALLSLYNLRSTPDRLRVLRRKTDDLATLREWQRRMGADTDAIAVFERLPDTQAPEPAELARQAQLTIPPDVRMRDRQPASEGWSTRAAELSWNSVRFVELARFIQTAESARPPWRLRECALAADSGEGRARATLVMEALEKKRP